MRPDRPERPKRFYTSVEVGEGTEGWSIRLDTRAVRTPAGNVLALPSEPLARAVAEEWEGQGAEIDIQAMHLTRLANVAIDRTPATRDALVDQVVAYCETDLICFLADDHEVRERQDALWRPWRDWAGRALGIMLIPVEGLVASPQPAASLQAARDRAGRYDDFALTGMAFACGLYGSAVLAFAVAEGALGGEAAFDASVIDESVQMERWGDDAEVLSVLASKRAEAAALQRWFGALDRGGDTPETGERS